MGAFLGWGSLLLLLLLQFVLSGWSSLLTVHGVVGADYPAGMLAGLFGGQLTVVLCWIAAVGAVLPGGLVALLMWRVRAGVATLAVFLVPLLLPLPYALLEGDTLLLFASPVALAQGMAIGALLGFLRLRGLNPDVLKAAANCGVGPISAYFRIVVRLALPAMAASALLAVLMQAAAITAMSAVMAGKIAGFVVPDPLRWDQLLQAVATGGGIAAVLALLMILALGMMRRQ